MRYFYPEVSAGGFTRRDGSIEFYSRVRSLVTRESVLLDYGAGRGRFLEDDVPFRQRTRSFKGDVKQVIGVDVDEAVLSNPSVDDAFVIDPEGNVPLGDESVDVIVSDFTFEHVHNPAIVGSELGRVLKSGGWICARTPNR